MMCIFLGCFSIFMSFNLNLQVFLNLHSFQHLTSTQFLCLFLLAMLSYLSQARYYVLYFVVQLFHMYSLSIIVEHYISAFWS